MINLSEYIASIELSSNLAAELDQLVAYLDQDQSDSVELDDIDVSSFGKLIETKAKKRPLGELDVNSFNSSKVN